MATISIEEKNICSVFWLSLRERTWVIYKSILEGHRPRLIGYHFSKDQISELTQAIEGFIQNESDLATIEEMKAYSKIIQRRSNGN